MSIIIKDPARKWIAEKSEEDYKAETQHILIPFFYKQGRISEEDYKEWLLDETGKFRPKVKM